MTERKIYVTISKLGDTKIDAEGFVGEECKNATQAIEMALAAGNAKVGDRDHKPEFYETNDAERESLRF